VGWSPAWLAALSRAAGAEVAIVDRPARFNGEDDAVSSVKALPKLHVLPDQRNKLLRPQAGEAGRRDGGAVARDRVLDELPGAFT
jgi:hypothetical protein